MEVRDGGTTRAAASEAQRRDGRTCSSHLPCSDGDGLGRHFSTFTRPGLAKAPSPNWSDVVLAASEPESPALPRDPTDDPAPDPAPNAAPRALYMGLGALGSVGGDGDGDGDGVPDTPSLGVPVLDGGTGGDARAGRAMTGGLCARFTGDCTVFACARSMSTMLLRDC